MSAEPVRVAHADRARQGCDGQFAAVVNLLWRYLRVAAMIWAYSGHPPGRVGANIGFGAAVSTVDNNGDGSICTRWKAAQPPIQTQYPDFSPVFAFTFRDNGSSAK